MYANKVEADPPPPPRHYNPPPPVRRSTNPYDADDTKSNHVRFPSEYDYPPRFPPPPPPPPPNYRSAPVYTNYTRPSSRRTHHTRYTSPVRDRREYSPVRYRREYSPVRYRREYSPVSLADSRVSLVLGPRDPKPSVPYYGRPVEGRERGKSEHSYVRKGDTDEEHEWDYVRPRRERTRGARDDEELYESDLDLAYEDGDPRNPGSSGLYSFVPSITSRDPLGDGGKISDDDSLETGDRASTTGGERVTGTAFQVLESRYTGDGLVGGQHGVELLAAPGEKAQHQPVFRWIHFAHKSLDFDEFASQAGRVAGLTKNERQAVADLVSRVQRQGIKRIQTSNGSSVRHMEPTFLQLPLPFDPNLKEQSFANRTITWICLPYFSLEKYSGLLGAESSGAFPIQTLLQAQFSRATKDRDMQQAVRQLKGAPAELCFHISQLWCIVLDNSLLLTCSRMSVDALCGALIHKTTKTAQEISSFKASARVFVRYQNNILWAIPVQECETWFAFIAHFLEFWPRAFRFFHYKRPVLPDDWPRISQLAARSRTGVVLEMQIAPKPKLPPPNVLGSPKQKLNEIEALKEALSQHREDELARRAETEKKVRIVVPPEGKEPAVSKPNLSFSVFTCLEGVANPTTNGINHAVLQGYFNQVDEYLLNPSKIARQDCKSYREARRSTRKAVFGLLEEEERVANATSESTRGFLHKDRVNFFNRADSIFGFFFPADLELPTTDRFWGIIHDLVEHPTFEEGDPKDPRVRESKARGEAIIHKLQLQRAELLRILDRQTAIDLPSLNEVFIHARSTDLNRIHTPWLLVDAWIHILLGLTVFPKSKPRSEILLESGFSSIREGLDLMIQSVASSWDQPLYDRSVLLPMDLVSLISLQLLEDITPALPDISETYSSYLDTIESDITTQSPTRAHEYKLGRLKQEMSIIQWTVAWQTSIFDAMSRCATTSRIWRVQPRSTMNPFAPVFHAQRGHRGVHAYQSVPVPDDKIAPHGYRQLMIDEVLNFLARREREFAELRSHAAHLEEFNRNKLDTTRDRQERAIYAFTIVTIIFLPLSSVASIFGMNSSDVRDMELGQWAYWATAVPVTIFVVFLGLWWTGELGNAIRSVVGWFQSLLGEQRRYGRGRWGESVEDMAPMAPMVPYNSVSDRIETGPGWREKGGYVVEGGARRRR